MGIARYVRDRENPHTAEIAVTVIDDYPDALPGPAK